MVHQEFPGDAYTLCGEALRPSDGAVPFGDSRADCVNCWGVAETLGVHRTRPGGPLPGPEHPAVLRAAQRAATGVLLRVLVQDVRDSSAVPRPPVSRRVFREATVAYLLAPGSGVTLAQIERADWDALYDHFYPQGVEADEGAR